MALHVLTCLVVPAEWWFLVGCSCGNLAYPHGIAAESRHTPPGTTGTIRLARRAARWQPLRVLTCLVILAEGTYLVGCSRDNLAIPDGSAAESRIHRQEQR
jgi:hypothetical protein